MGSMKMFSPADLNKTLTKLLRNRFEVWTVFLELGGYYTISLDF